VNDEDFSNYLPEVDSFDETDLVLPRWRISKEDGQFLNNVTGESRPQLEVVIIRADKSRFYWPPEFREDNMPLCYSIDGIHPAIRPDGWGTHRDDQIWCKGCVASLWDEGKPLCSISYNYLLCDIDDGSMAVLNLSRARAKVGRELNSCWKLYGVSRPVLLWTERFNHVKGTFYQVRYQIQPRLGSWSNYVSLMLANRGTKLTSTLTEIKTELLEEPEAEDRAVNTETGELL
jgi:hypothetical protein